MWCSSFICFEFFFHTERQQLPIRIYSSKITYWFLSFLQDTFYARGKAKLHFHSSSSCSLQNLLHNTNKCWIYRRYRQFSIHTISHHLNPILVFVITKLGSSGSDLKILLYYLLRLMILDLKIMIFRRILILLNSIVSYIECIKNSEICSIRSTLFNFFVTCEETSCRKLRSLYGTQRFICTRLIISHNWKVYRQLLFVVLG